MKKNIKINHIIDISGLVTVCSQLPCANEIFLKQGPQVVNAASLMGVFTIDLSKGAEIDIPDKEEVAPLLEYIEEFII